ncbi:molybdopterin-dependent oxidoreductase [Nocardia sp. NPDC005825]|uniref:molybdopterin-containing oxidoreductase family protein n=1 Tax=unclassified Nocardia TaxID=2637762 RepID=UPI0033CB7BD1
MTVREQATFCRICEPFCGMIATVENDKLIGLRPDPDNVASKGFACSKGMAYASVQNDPDRITHPIKRMPDGTFVRVSWDEAMADISSRLKRIVDESGGESVAWYSGNPSALSYSHALWTQGFLKAIGSRHWYGAGSQDTNSRFAASSILYGTNITVPVPDFDRTELAVIIGANPAVSHGSLASVPRIMDKLHGVVERGGRVVVIDPRRTETAHEFEWIPVTPDSDALLLLSLANVLLTEGLVDRERVARMATGLEALERAVTRFAPESTEGRTRVPAGVVRTLARDLVGRRALLYSRLGLCLGTSPTLANYLLDVVNLLAGNLDAEGGAVFCDNPLLLRELLALTGLDTYDTWRTRVGNLPEVLGTSPAANMVAEIRTPGKGQIRALFVSAGNPVISTPGGDRLEDALGELDLMVSFDFYINETGSHADYVLPGTAMYEREDVAMVSQSLMPVPWAQATQAVVPPAGEARPEWEAIDQLARALGTRALPTRAARVSARIGEMVGVRVTPKLMADALIRSGRYGDKFGLRRSGFGFDSLAERAPHGLRVAETAATGLIRKAVRHRDKKMHLDHAGIWREVERLAARQGDSEHPFLVIGQREPRSENSWMHNVPKLRAARSRHSARINPADAEALGVVQRGVVRLVSPYGAIELPALVTDEIAPGVIAVPHGWGHKGRGQWSLANSEGGASINDLMTTEPAELDPLSGMSHLNGVRVRVEAVEPAVGV